MTMITTPERVDHLRNFTSYALDLRKKAHEYGERINCYPDLNAFSTIHNYLTLIAEVLDAFYLKWKDAGKDILEPQDKQRIVEISKWGYAMSFFMVEHIIMETIKRKNHHSFNEINKKLRNNKYVSFNKIMNISRYNLYLDDDGKKVLDALRDIRNAIAHNNAIMSKDGVLEYDGFKYEYHKNESLKGGIILPLKFIDILLSVSYTYINTINNLV